MKKMKFGVFALSLAFVFTACSSDDVAKTASNTGTLKISAHANYGNSLSRSTENGSVEKYIVNFKEIELELKNGFYNSDDDIELKGPFEIDLLSGNNIQ